MLTTPPAGVTSSTVFIGVVSGEEVAGGADGQAVGSRRTRRTSRPLACRWGTREEDPDAERPAARGESLTVLFPNAHRRQQEAVFHRFKRRPRP